MVIVTLDEARQNLGIEDTRDDAALARTIAGLEGRFEDHLRRLLARCEGQVDTMDGGGRWLFLRRFPVETVTEVRIDAAQNWGDETIVDATDVRLNAERGYLAYGPCGVPWPAGVCNIRVTYTGGYVPAGQTAGTGQHAMPEAIRRALLLQLGFEWRNKNNLGAASVSAQGASVALAPAKLLPEVEDALAPYIRYV